MSRTCAYSPIYIFLCTVLVTLRRLGQISYHFDNSRTLQYIHQYLYARWSTFSDRFHDVSFTMQSHDHNWSLSLTSNGIYVFTLIELYVESDDYWKGEVGVTILHIQVQVYQSNMIVQERNAAKIKEDSWKNLKHTR